MHRKSRDEIGERYGEIEYRGGFITIAWFRPRSFDTYYTGLKVDTAT